MMIHRCDCRVTHNLSFYVTDGNNQYIHTPFTKTYFDKLWSKMEKIVDRLVSKSNKLASYMTQIWNGKPFYYQAVTPIYLYIVHTYLLPVYIQLAYIAIS